MEHRQIKINFSTKPVLLLLFIHLFSSGLFICTAQVVDIRDKKNIPLLVNGRFYVNKILVIPNLFRWKGDSIGATFQKNDTTDISEFLRSRFVTDSLPKIQVEEKKVSFYTNYVLLDSRYLEATFIFQAPYTLKSSKSYPGYFSYFFPLKTESGNDYIEGRFDCPSGQLTLTKEIYVTNENVSKSHQLILIATMTDRIDYNNHKKYVPLVLINK